MKSRVFVVATLLVLLMSFLPARAQIYWDLNGTADGAGSTVPSGAWDSGTPNWNSDPTGGTSGVMLPWDGSLAVFSAGGEATGAYTITLSGTQSTNGITFENGTVTITGGDGLNFSAGNTIDTTTQTATIDSIIGGIAGLAKSGTGTLNLNGANIFTGGAFLNGGTTNISADNNLGPTANDVSFSVATLRTTAAIPAFTHNVVMNGTGTVNTNGFDSTFSGAFSGGSSFTKSGAGVLTLSGDSPTFSGSLIVAANGGTLKVTNSGAFGVAGTSTASAVTLNNNSTLEITDGVTVPDRVNFNTAGPTIHKTGTGTSTIIGGISFGGAGSVIVDAGGTLQLGGATTQAVFGPGQPTFGGDGDIVTTAAVSGISANLNLAVGAVQIIKTGSGTMTLNGISSNTEGWKILGGTVVYTSDGSGTGSSYNLGRPQAAFDADNLIIDGGTLKNTFVNTTSSTSYTPITTNRGIQVGPNGGTIDLSPTATSTNPIPVGIYSGTIGATGPTGVLIKTGVAEFRYSGTTRAATGFTQLIVKQGLFRLGSVSGADTELGFGAAPAVPTDDAIVLDGGSVGASFGVTLHDNRGITVASSGGTINGSGATMTMPASSATKLTGSGPLTIAGTTGNGFILNAPLSDYSGALTVNGLFNLGAGVNLNVNSLSGNASGRIGINAAATLSAGSDNTDTIFTGLLTATAGVFTKVGTGTLTIDSASGEWANTGGVNINDGTLKFGSSAVGLSNVVPVSIDSGATLDMNSTNDTFGSLSGQGTVSRTTANLTLAATTGLKTFDGTINGTGAFTKSAGATQILNGANTFGAVNVSGGSLILNGANTTDAVTVGGGTLGGSGSVTGAVTVNADGHIAPGSSAGILTTGDATFNAGSFFDIELGGLTPGTQFDRLTSTGAATINGGTLTLSLIDGFMPTLGDAFQILTAATGLTKNADLTLDATNAPAPSGTQWLLSYQPDFLQLSLASLSSELLGDYNDDGKVDAADYVLFRKNEGTNNPLPHDDGLNVPIGPAHYDLWRANFGNPSGSGSGLGSSGAVPEPGSIMLVLAGLCAAGLRRQR